MQRLCPAARVARMDLDVMGDKAKFRALVERFEEGELDVLVGTQMVAKGLDFERVKLVGVLDADGLIGNPDFRAEERLYAMLLQVSGRSGRKGKQGKVVIQAADLDERVYASLMRGDYQSFYSLVASERELFRYPPFYRLIQLELRHKDERLLRLAANDLALRLRQRLVWRVCGPAIPVVSQIRGMKRVVLLLKGEPGLALTKLKCFLKESVSEVLKNNDFRALRVYFDVDPF